MERLSRFQKRDLMEVGDYWSSTKGFKFLNQKDFYMGNDCDFFIGFAN